MVENKVVFTTRTGSAKKGLLMLDPELGKYSGAKHPGFEVQQGEKLEFYCPICSSNLAATGINENLVMILMLDEEDHEHEVYFSRIEGEESTYMVSHMGFKSMGKNAPVYLKYFKLSEKYKGLI